jgi:F-type H+-transporting ATPase subunit delta
MANGNTDSQLRSSAATDTGALHVGGVYAKGLLGAAVAAGVVDGVLGELDWLIDDVLDVFPDFETTLVSRLLSTNEKSEMLDRVMTGRTSEIFRIFLKVVGQHDRLDCLRAIRTEGGRLHDEMRGIVRVAVRTAAPMEAAQQDMLINRLRSLTGGQPALDLTIDPSLIGGVVFQVGDTIFDGSIARQLQLVREQMIDRSVHEIQSRRDSFSYTTGN